MIVVTGGAGFIGSNLVKGLNGEGFNNILIVDDLENGDKHKNLVDLEFMDYVDYRDFLAIKDQFAIKMVFHQGACSDTTERNGRYMMQTNYEYSKSLLWHCVERRIRFIYASSASVYGNGEKGFAEREECEAPLNIYAFSKCRFDRYVNLYKDHFTSQVAGLRYFNVYGPREWHKGKMASVAYHLHCQVKRGEPMKLFEGSENFRRDFIHVDDVVKVNLFLMNRAEVSGVFNCGTGKAGSFMSIAKTMRSLYPEAELALVPFPDELKGKYQDYTQADLTKLRQTGYAASFMDIDEGVRRYMRELDSQ